MLLREAWTSAYRATGLGKTDVLLASSKVKGAQNMYMTISIIELVAIYTYVAKSRREHAACSILSPHLRGSYRGAASWKGTHLSVAVVPAEDVSYYIAQ